MEFTQDAFLEKIRLVVAKASAYDANDETVTLAKQLVELIARTMVKISLELQISGLVFGIAKFAVLESWKGAQVSPVMRPCTIWFETPLTAQALVFVSENIK